MVFDKLLVLDLDETLIHASDGPLGRPEDARVGSYFIYWRPGITRFVERALTHFAAVGVWTAGTLDYAHPVLDGLLDRSRLAFVWGRERCTYHVDQETRDPEWLKDVKKLRRRGYDRRKILVVDDTPRKLARSYGNLVPVRPFLGDPLDDELPMLWRYLEMLGPQENMRQLEKRGWRRRLQHPPSAEDASP